MKETEEYDEVMEGAPCNDPAHRDSSEKVREIIEDKRQYRLVLHIQHWVPYDQPHPSPLGGQWVNETGFGPVAQSFYTAGTRAEVEEARKEILMPGWRATWIQEGSSK